MVNGAPKLRLTDGVETVLTDGFLCLPLVKSQIPSCIWPKKVTKHCVRAKLKYRYLSIFFIFFNRRVVHPGLGQLGTRHPPINCGLWPTVPTGTAIAEIRKDRSRQSHPSPCRSAILQNCQREYSSRDHFEKREPIFHTSPFTLHPSLFTLHSFIHTACRPYAAPPE